MPVSSAAPETKLAQISARAPPKAPNFDHQFRVAQAYPVTHRGAVHFRIGAAIEATHDVSSSEPIIWALKPYTWRAPAYSTSSTSRS